MSAAGCGVCPAPQVRVDVAVDHGTVAKGVWRARWQVANDGDGPMLVEESWFPHGRFRGERVAYAPAEVVGTGATREFTATVYCHEPPGAVVENAFLILRVRWQGRPWRVFARLTVTCAQLPPRPQVEVVTAEPIEVEI